MDPQRWTIYSATVTQRNPNPRRSLARPAPLPGADVPTPPLSTLSRFAGPLFIGVAALVMLIWTWGTWPDVQVDFGREAYIAWRLSEGDALYRDIAYYNGPLSPYLNALWFNLFGVGLRTLMLCNLAILAALVWLLYTLVVRISDRFTATVATLVFVLLFAFNPYVLIANYNYVCPYSHDAVHGVVLSLLAILTLDKWTTPTRTRWAALSGFLLGLVFLTRSEVFLAAVVGVGAGSAWLWHAARDERRKIGDCALIAAACSIVPAAIAFALLALAMPAGNALVGTLGTWPATLAGDVASMQFFRAGAGLADVRGSLRELFHWLAWYVAALGPAILAAAALRRETRGTRWLAVAACVLIAAPISEYWYRVYENRSPFGLFRPLPLLALVCCGMALGGSGGGESPRRATALSFFSLALLAKIFLNARIVNYGFYLAMPATLMGVVLLVGWLPAAIERRGGAGIIARGAGLGGVVGVTLTMLFVAAFCLRNRSLSVGTGADVLRADSRGEAFNIALKELERRMTPGETLVALPEGVMLNYLSRRRNPTRHTNFMPTEMVLFGEANILADLQAHPPDWIVLVHKDTREFGSRFFGRDYARSLRDWVDREYRPVHGIGAMPLQGDDFGMLILRRRTDAVTTRPAS